MAIFMRISISEFNYHVMAPKPSNNSKHSFFCFSCSNTNANKQNLRPTHFEPSNLETTKPIFTNKRPQPHVLFFFFFSNTFLSKIEEKKRVMLHRPVPCQATARTALSHPEAARFA
jgi:hypothetical protein